MYLHILYLNLFSVDLYVKSSIAFELTAMLWLLQGYKVIGSHSGVKLCRWTKSQLRGRGGCYKHSFYGIESHRFTLSTLDTYCTIVRLRVAIRLHRYVSSGLSTDLPYIMWMSLLYPSKSFQILMCEMVSSISTALKIFLKGIPIYELSQLNRA